MGRKDDARRIAAALEKALGPMDQWGLAIIYAALGQNDAFLWLDGARKSRLSWMPWVSDFPRCKLDLLGPLRSDPRFAAITRQIGTSAGSRQSLGR